MGSNRIALSNFNKTKASLQISHKTSKLDLKILMSKGFSLNHSQNGQ